MGHEKGNLDLHVHHAHDFSLWPVKLESVPRINSSQLIKLSIEVPGYKEWKPGQFVMLRWGQHLVGRPYSIVQWKQKDQKSLLQLWINNKSKATQELLNLKAQDVLTLTGPLGIGFGEEYTKELNKRILYVSLGGTVAAHWALVELRKKLLLSQNKTTDFWVHLESRKENLDPELMARAYAKPDLIFSPTQHWVQDLASFIKKEQGSFTDIHFALDSKHLLELIENKTSFLADQIKVRIDERMACGIGLCFSCSVSTSQGNQRSCLHGPWFDLNKVDYKLLHPSGAVP